MLLGAQTKQDCEQWTNMMNSFVKKNKAENGQAKYKMPLSLDVGVMHSQIE